jgi:hypothetical protein
MWRQSHFDFVPARNGHGSVSQLARRARKTEERRRRMAFLLALCSIAVAIAETLRVASR